MFYLVLKKETQKKKIWFYCYPDNANAKGEPLVLTLIVFKVNGEGKKWQSSKGAFVLA